jgi:RHH-type proline utilization regulon transcriptional repressor/proline dehydrogenase/delta 1-pyrroline-5-carboxylate dehydrogenase
MFAGSAAAAALLRQRLAAQDGALVPLLLPRDGAYATARLVCERTLAINTTAAGGNASLLSLTEATP